MEIYKLYRNEKGEKSRKLKDLVGVGDILTLNKGFVARDKDNRNETLFEEVWQVPFEEWFDLTGEDWVGKLNCRSRKCSKEGFADAFIEAFERQVEEMWLAGGTNIVFHSSGYDSRMLSGIVRRLADRNGRDWLGRIVFACMSPEEDWFVRIMEYLGFDDTQYYLYRRDQMREMEFGKIWESTNGAAEYPLNSPYWMLVEIGGSLGIREGEKVQVLSAAFFNEIFDFKYFEKYQADLTEWVRFFYNHRYMQFTSALPYNIKFPILGRGTFQLAAEVDIDLTPELRKFIMKRLDEGLFEVERMPDRILTDYRNIGAKDRKRIFNRYRQSWYGREVCPLSLEDVPERMESNEFWSHWTTASWCEGLRDAGGWVIG